jgi:hypothetical protein
VLVLVADDAGWTGELAVSWHPASSSNKHQHPATSMLLY